MAELDDAWNRIRALEKRVDWLEGLVSKLLAGHREPEHSAPAAKSGDTIPDLPALDLDALYPKTEPLKPLTVSAAHSTAALERYPHILEKISLLWGHPECGLLIERLFVDDRGNRKGFDKDVIEEIMLLGEIARELAFLGPPKVRR